MSASPLGTPAPGSRVLGVNIRAALRPILAAGVLGIVAARFGGIRALPVAGGLAAIAAGACRLWGLHPGAWVLAWSREALRGKRRHRFAAPSIVMADVHANHARVLGRGDAEVDAAWERLLRVRASGCRPGDRVLVRSVVVPAIERMAPEGDDDRRVAGLHWTSETSVSLARSRRGRLHRAELTRALRTAALAVHGVVSIEPVPCIDEAAWAFLPPGLSPSCLRELPDRLTGTGLLVRALRVRRFPAGVVSSASLQPLFAPAPPRRVVSLVASPLDPGHGLRVIGRTAVEVAADQRMRTDHGYRLGVEEATTAHRLEAMEHQLTEGHRLCRWELLVVVAAPDLRGLEAATALVVERAATCRLDLELGWGHQRSWVESALAGAERWT